ncbi:amidase [Rhodocista pekingensis]|uniref:Amidase n=1 Tax=Rhodocista pekingensis TaxID=201185 RepID=A0ABW2KYP4_9PROT
MTAHPEERDGARRPGERVEAQLARIVRLDGKLKAFALTLPETAREAAWRQEREPGTGPLAGRTLAVKDLIDLRGVPTSAGARTPVVEEATATAGALDRLLRAGMIPLGKAATVELAFGTWGINRATGTPRNPWDMTVARVPGGSSSGSAVAVAAGLADTALGSDTGGSIRIPCALNGISGIKTTVGRVSRAGVVPLSPTLDTVGPMAWTVAEAAAMLEAMTGADPADPATLDRPGFGAAGALAQPVRGCRLAVLGDADLASVADPVGSAYLEALSVLEKQGARLHEVRPAVAPGACVEPTGRLIGAEGWRRWADRVERFAPEMDPGTLARLQAAASSTDAEHARLLAARAADQGRFHAWMQDFDALLTPTVPIPAPALDTADETTLPFSTFTRMANWLDLPAVALPCGQSGEGLPVSLQVLALPWGEAAAVAVAHAFQQATDWHRRRPPGLPE